MVENHTQQHVDYQQGLNGQQAIGSNVDLMLDALKNAHRELSWLNLELHLVTETPGSEAELFQYLIAMRSDSETLLNQMESLAVALKAAAETGGQILIRPSGRIVHCPDLPTHLKEELNRVQAEMKS